MHLSASIGTGKAPMDLTMVRIALRRQSQNVPPQMIEALHTFGQTASLKNADLDRVTGYKPRQSGEPSVSYRGRCAGVAALCRARRPPIALGRTALARR